MHVVTVFLNIHQAHYNEFMQAMVKNACTSLATEPGCRQFDVCESDAGDSRVFLYEVYDTLGCFQSHLVTPHFLQFNAQTAAWVIDKSVQVFSLDPSSAGVKKFKHDS